MKKRKLFLIALIFALAMALAACHKPDPGPESAPESAEDDLYTVIYMYDGGYIETLELPADKVDERVMENIVIDGETYGFAGWQKEVDEEARTIVATATFTRLPARADNLLPARAVDSGKLFAPDAQNEVLVVFVSFTDGPSIDRAEFEALFTGDFSGTDTLRSVSAYYRANSYGLDLLHFNFIYYDSGMTSAEAWHYVNDEDENGRFVGNDFFFDIFDSLNASGDHDFSRFDTDGDGFVDLSLFIFGEDTDKTPDGASIYGSASGFSDRIARGEKTELGQYVKIGCGRIAGELLPAEQIGGIRVLIHEIGHAFGIPDYYDFYWYNDTIISPLGLFDMHESDRGDLNPFSKFMLGWLHPYVITEDFDRITLRLACSSTRDDAILIPTSAGWNGTAFDEYLLIDVMAPQGANGFDWPAVRDYDEVYEEGTPHPSGGVRIYHVDARLAEIAQDGTLLPVGDPIAAAAAGKRLTTRFYNTNGIDPAIPGDDRTYHLLEIVPRDGSGRFRLGTPTYASIFAVFCTKDLFGPGDVFDPSAAPECFAGGDVMNNGGTLNYQITVDAFDESAGIATVTITKISHE